MTGECQKATSSVSATINWRLLSLWTHPLSSHVAAATSSTYLCLKQPCRVLHTHTQRHTPTHLCTQTNTHTHKHPPTHTHTHTHTHICTDTHPPTHISILHSYIHTYTHCHILPHLYTLTRAHARRE